MTDRYTILVVQTERQKLLDVITSLNTHFPNVVAVSDDRALEMTASLQPDLIVTDYSVSDMAGIVFFKKLITDPVLGLIPTLFVSDSRSYDYRLNAYEIGATDFVSRPLDVIDLCKRSSVHIRNRRILDKEGSVSMGNLELRPKSKEVFIDGKPAALTDLEFRILHCLLTTPRPIITRSEIYKAVWGQDMSDTGRLDTQLYNLKKKIKSFDGKIKSINKIGMRILASESIFFQESKKPARPQRSQDQRPL
ncbi:MAG: response regulator transcription factor [Bdellovibrionaceae bacterium]|nr:response regulator transcription factor [Pseudobdellovibrionaceae bacterium]